MAWIYQAKKNSEDLSQILTDLKKKYQGSETNRVTDEGEDLTVSNKTAMFFSYLRYWDLDVPTVKALDPDTQSSYVYPSIEPDLDTCQVLIPLDEAGVWALDRSGFGHNASVNGVPRFQKSSLDRYNIGGNLEYLFDGRSTFVTIPHYDELDIPNLTEFSVYITALHFDPDFIVNYFHRIFSKSSPTNPDNNQYQLMIGTAGDLQAKVIKNGTTWQRRSNSTGYFQDNTSVEVVMTFSTTNGIIIYVNGSPISTYDSSAEFLNTPAVTGLALGRFWPVVSPPAGERWPPLGYSLLWYGSMSYFVFWNRELSSTEVTNLYTNKLTTASRARGSVGVGYSTFIKD